MNKTTKIIIWVIVAIIVVGGIWYEVSRKPAEKGTIKIGAILPLTGDLAIYGEGIKNAINLAIETSGLKDKVQLIIEDDMGCQPKDAVSAAQKLVNIDKVEGVIGCVCSGATMAIAPITEQNKIILISPSATSKSITKAGDYVYRVIASDADKAVAVGKLAYNKGYRKAALLFDTANDAFVQQRTDVRETFEKLGGQIVADESFVTKDKDFKSQLTKIKSSDTEIIFMGAFSKEGALVLKQAKELSVNSIFIATETLLGTQDVINIVGSAADGLIFPFAETPGNKEYTEFINLYKVKYNQDPPAYAAEGYDATMLLIKAITKSNRMSNAIRDQLQKIGQNYYGASGVITFDQNGDVQKPMIIKTIKNGQFVPYNE